MDKFMDLGTLVLLIMIAAGLITILYRLFKMKKDDGKVDDDERTQLFQQVRDMALNLVKEALEIQKQQEQGEEFVREYIITKLTIVISEATILTQPEKDIIITYLLEEAVDTVLKLIGYDIVKMKQKIAQTNYYQKLIVPNTKVTYDNGSVFDSGIKYE
jgi:hypothetical protein